MRFMKFFVHLTTVGLLTVACGSEVPVPETVTDVTEPVEVVQEDGEEVSEDGEEDLSPTVILRPESGTGELGDVDRVPCVGSEAQVSEWWDRTQVVGPGFELAEVTLIAESSLPGSDVFCVGRVITDGNFRTSVHWTPTSGGVLSAGLTAGYGGVDGTALTCSMLAEDVAFREARDFGSGQPRIVKIKYPTETSRTGGSLVCGGTAVTETGAEFPANFRAVFGPGQFDWVLEPKGFDRSQPAGLSQTVSVAGWSVTVSSEPAASQTERYVRLVATRRSRNPVSFGESVRLAVLGLSNVERKLGCPNPGSGGLDTESVVHQGGTVSGIVCWVPDPGSDGSELLVLAPVDPSGPVVYVRL